jgi:hypothetical protein
VTTSFGGDIRREVRSSVIHREDDACDFQSGIEMVANEVDGGNQLSESFKCVVLRLERDQNGIGCGKCVHREQAERRRAIEQDVVVLVPGWEEKATEPPFTLVSAGEFDFGSRQLDRRRRQRYAARRRHHDDLFEGYVLDECLVQRSWQRASIDSEAARRVALGIDIDDKNALACEGEIRSEVYNRRGLSDAALLIGAGDRLTHSGPPR